MELLSNNPSMQDLIQKLNEVVESLNNNLSSTNSEIAEVKELVNFGSDVLASRLNAKLWYFKTQEFMKASTELCDGDSCFILNPGSNTGEGTFEYWYIYKTDDVGEILDSYIELSNPDLVGVKIQELTFKALLSKFDSIKKFSFLDLVTTATETNPGKALDAIVGKLLADRIGNLGELSTTNKGSLVGAIKEIKTVVENNYSENTRKIDSKAERTELQIETSERKQEIAVERARINNLLKSTSDTVTSTCEVSDEYGGNASAEVSSDGINVQIKLTNFQFLKTWESSDGTEATASPEKILDLPNHSFAPFEERTVVYTDGTLTYYIENDSLYVTSSTDTISIFGDVTISYAIIDSLQSEVADIRVGADGKVYGTAGEAVQGQVSELKGDLSYISEVTKNLFNKSSIVNGFVNNSGEVQLTDTTLWTSEYIDVGGNNFTLSWSIAPLENVIRVAYYNDNEEFISRTVESISPSMRYVVFANSVKAKYIRVSTKYGMEDGFQVEIGNSKTDYESHLTAKDNVARKYITEKKYDACIIGGGASGVACAYALKCSGLKVALIEKNHYLGGTHTVGYVSSLVPAPAPLFLKDVTYEQIKKGQAIISNGEHDPLTVEESLALDWKRTYYHNPNSYCCIFNPVPLALKYYEDLSPFIDVYLNEELVNATSNSVGFVNYIETDKHIFYAKQFIDCTANDVLLRKIGADVYYGGDSKTRYQSEYGFTEPNGADDNYDFCNATTLVYRIARGTEDLSNITAEYYNNAAYWYYNSDPNKIYFNSINYVSGANSGINIINNGVDAEYNRLKGEMIKHWKTLKIGKLLPEGMLPHLSTKYKFDGVAPMLGIRESYRAKCERMLGENAMYTKVSKENIKSPESHLDKIIAVGGYIADLLNDPQISDDAATAISQNIKEFGVPYGCLIPKGWNNVLVASRGAGFSHITASSFRLTRHMMQIGWVAGHATRLMHEEELSDYKTINVEQLQSAGYADVVGLVNDVLSL